MKQLHSRLLPTVRWIGLVGLLSLGILPASADEAAPTPWKSLFNGKDFTGWEKYLAPLPGSRTPLGVNNDPRGVFTVTQVDGAPAIHVSGEVYGAITTADSFDNVHIRLEYKWGPRKWPPRNGPRHHRDTGLLYWCVGPHGAGSDAWMRSVECNIMEKGVGQWWSVAGVYCDVEAVKLVLDKAPWVPYRGEADGETCFVYQPGFPRTTVPWYDGITPAMDYEKAFGEWNVCEAVAWGNVGIHLLNGKVNLVITNPRYRENGREIPMHEGKIQLQSEAAEVYFRRIEARSLDRIPDELLSWAPAHQDDEAGFVSLLGKTADEGWAQSGPGRFVVNQGVATGEGGMGLWWMTNRTFTNFVLRGEWMQEQPKADSGVFVRFPAPGSDPWMAVNRGHELEIGDSKPEQPTWATGSIYPFQAPVAVPVKPHGQWNQYELTCVGQNYSVRINGQLVNTWTDRKQRTASGYLGLQNYNDGLTVRHRNLRVKDLP